MRSLKLMRIAAAGSSALVALSLAGAALATEGVAPVRGAVLQINPQGKVVINHAEVASIGSSSLTIKVWGSIWTVNTTADTKIVRKHGGASTLAGFSVGDRVNVRGSIVEGQNAVNATHLRNASTREAAFRGTVKTVTAPDTFTVETERGVRTVKVTSDTKFTSSDQTKTFADILVGAKVGVKGFMNSSMDVVTAQRVNIKAAPAGGPQLNP